MKIIRATSEEKDSHVFPDNIMNAQIKFTYLYFNINQKIMSAAVTILKSSN